MATEKTEIRYRRAADIMGTAVEDEFILMSLATAQFHLLEGPNFVIWEALEAEKTLAELVAILIKTYDIDQETCLVETQAALDALLEQKILEISA